MVLDKIILMMDEGFTVLDSGRRKKLKEFLELAHPNCSFYPIANLNELKTLSALEQEPIRDKVSMVILGIYNLQQTEVEKRFGKAEVKCIPYIGVTQEYIRDVGEQIRKLSTPTLPAG